MMTQRVQGASKPAVHTIVEHHHMLSSVAFEIIDDSPTGFTGGVSSDYMGYNSFGSKEEIAFQGTFH